MLTDLQAVPPDPTFALLGQYAADERPEKVNLVIGMYQDTDGKPFVFPSVQKAFSQVDTTDFNYQPIGGNQQFLELAREFLFADTVSTDQLAAVATCGGTQACRVFADLIERGGEKRKLLVGTPTWVNHFAVFKAFESQSFPHLDVEGNCDVQGYLKAIQDSEKGSFVVLHGGLAHNPTGKNIPFDQLDELIAVCREQESIVFIDFAYCGLAEGLEADKAYLQKLFQGLEDVAVGFSFSKSASLYEHRTGALFVKTNRKEVIESHLQQSLREMVSMAPGLGQEIMIRVFSEYRKEWEGELETVRQQIEGRKQAFLSQLPESFAGLNDCRGMFGLLPLNEAQVTRLREEFGVYVLANARVNFSGVREENLEYVVDSIQKVL